MSQDCLRAEENQEFSWEEQQIIAEARRAEEGDLEDFASDLDNEVFEDQDSQLKLPHLLSSDTESEDKDGEPEMRYVGMLDCRLTWI